VKVHLPVLHKLRNKMVVDCLGIRIGRQAGVSRFIEELLRRVSRNARGEYTIIANRTSGRFFVDLLGEASVVVAPASGDSRVTRLLIQCFLYPICLRLFRPRLFVSTVNMPMWGYGCRRMTVVLDLLAFDRPETFGIIEGWLKRLLISQAVRSADAVLTISRSSAKAIALRFKGRLRGKVWVVRPAAEWLQEICVSEKKQAATLESYGLARGRYVLSVLGGRSYKNQNRLLAAFCELACKNRCQVKLAIAGYAKAVVDVRQAGSNVVVAGYVSDEALAALYLNAAALAFPSLYEGFGIPVVEAQSAGIPVVCSDLPVLREVAGPAAVFVDPNSTASIAEGLRRALEDNELRRRLIEQGLRNSRRYSWDRSAERFVKICRAEMTQ
jgi:glycosyltransferase involved in cell wall biosynthesis